MIHTIAWVLGIAGAGMLLLAAMAWDVRHDATLAVLVAAVGLLLLSQGVRLARWHARMSR